MKELLILSVLIFGWNFSSLAQNKEKKSHNKSLVVPADKSLNGSLNFKIEPSAIVPLDSTVQIPNAYKFKDVKTWGQIQPFEIKPADDSVILQKKLDGKESALMPGTERLEPFGRNNKIDTLKTQQLIQPIKKK